MHAFSDTLGCASCATFLFLPHFDVICDLLLNRRMATWNLFVNKTYVNTESICLQSICLLSPTSVLYPKVAIMEMVQKGYGENLGGEGR